MYAIDTEEKLEWFMNALENEEIQFVSRELTNEDREEIRREIAEYRILHQKEKVGKELVYA